MFKFTGWLILLIFLVLICAGQTTASDVPLDLPHTHEKRMAVDPDYMKKANALVALLRQQGFSCETLSSMSLLTVSVSGGYLVSCNMFETLYKVENFGKDKVIISVEY